MSQELSLGMSQSAGDASAEGMVATRNYTRATRQQWWSRGANRRRKEKQDRQTAARKGEREDRAEPGGQETKAGCFVPTFIPLRLRRP